MPNNTSGKKRLSFTVIIISGVIAAFFLLIALLFVQGLLGAWGSSSGKDIDDLLKKRKYKEALLLIDSRGEKDNVDYDMLIQKGKIWLALAWERQNRERWANYGKNEKDWMNTAETGYAEKVMKQAIDINKERVDAYYYLGILYMEKGWFSLAESEFLEVLKRKEDHIQSRINLGVVYSKIQRYDMAEKELLDAYRKCPNNVSAAKNLAVLYRFYLDEPESAMVWSNRYLNMKPQNDYDINVIRSELQEMLQRYPEFALEEPQSWKVPRRFKSRK